MNSCQAHLESIMSTFCMHASLFRQMDAGKPFTSANMAALLDAGQEANCAMANSSAP